ncbi:4-carboxymuconolactone decarboxylase family [Fusarium pseudocircinatum]|uniref:4-carboxymuconolactone decarboxylase family n=1 Tax=Fusarium pseudocircinatum TaxID=56676 RepID=A0A8H5PLP3_9HYPO|nr:4-carboxymuconolactone decarboxylase family [Fusarium pseudocircinatum]
MRVPYIPNPPPTSSPEEEAIVAAIAARRHPRPIQPLDLALLHSPHVAAGWNTFVGAVRTKTSLADDLRELAICRIAVVNRACGVSSASMNEIMREEGLVRSERPEGFNEKQWAVCVVADEMTRNVQVKDETFEWLKSLASDQEVVEVVATVNLFLQSHLFFKETDETFQVACYNCVSRFLVALDVGERNNTVPEPLAK